MARPSLDEIFADKRPSLDSIMADKRPPLDSFFAEQQSEVAPVTPAVTPQAVTPRPAAPQAVAPAPIASQNTAITRNAISPQIDTPYTSAMLAAPSQPIQSVEDKAPMSPVTSAWHGAARGAYALAQGAVEPVSGVAQVLNSTDPIAVNIGKRVVNASANVAQRLGLISPETEKKVQAVAPMQNLPDGPVQSGLKKTAQAIDWMRTGEGSPIARTEQEIAAHPVMSRISGAVENFLPVVPQIVASQGSSVALGTMAGLGRFASAKERYLAEHPEATQAEAETAATPGAAVEGTMFGLMPAVGKAGRSLLAKAAPGLYPKTAEGVVKYGAKEFVRDTAATVAADAPYMVAQNMLVGETEKGMGVSPDYKATDALKWDNLLETALITAFFGGHQSLAARKQARVLSRAVRDTSASPANRLAAVKAIADTMEARGATEQAKAFAEQASHKILTGENKDILRDKAQDLLNENVRNRKRQDRAEEALENLPGQIEALLKEQEAAKQNPEPVVPETIPPVSKTNAANPETKGGDTNGEVQGQGQRGREVAEPEIPVAADGGADIPEHIIRAVDEPHEVAQSVTNATKQMTKDTLYEKMKSGEIASDSPIRLTNTQELNHILETGELRIGEDAEGRQGISAQTMGKTPVIVGYGGNGISAAIVFDKSHVEGKGMAPNEVKINPTADVRSLRFVIDGHKELLTFDQLREAIAAQKGGADDIQPGETPAQKAQVTEPVAPETVAAPEHPAADRIRNEIAKLQAQYDKKLNAKGRAAMVPPAIKAAALAKITEKMDKLEAQLKNLPSPEEAAGFKGILDHLEGQTYQTKVKTKKGNKATVSDFNDTLNVEYPTVGAMELTGKKDVVMAALRNFTEGKPLVDVQQQVIDAFRYDIANMKEYADRKAAEQEEAESFNFGANVEDQAGDFTLTGEKEPAKAPKEKQEDLFKTAPTFGKKAQGKGVAEENPMEAEVRERKAEAGQQDMPGTEAPRGAGFADTGGYAKRSTPTRQNFLEQPELVQLAKDIMGGEVPKLVKKIADRVLGRFTYNKVTGEKEIRLRRDLWAGPLLKEEVFKGSNLDREAAFLQFQARVRNEHAGADWIFRQETKGGKTTFRAYDKDPNYVMKTLAHEIGHAVDYLKDSMVRGRGNILGHIAALKRYGKDYLSMYAGAKGQPLEKEDIARLKRFARLNTPKGEDIVTTVTREVPKFEEVGITPEMVRAIWQDVNGREKYPDLYLFLAKMSDAEKKAIVVQAMKGIVDARLNALKNKRQVGTETITETIVTPAKQRPGAVKAEFERLLRLEIEKRRLYEKSVIMDELKALTQTWKPFDVGRDPHFTKYRHSPEELYADAISVLVNEPQLLKDTAPSFYKAFMYYAGQRPEFSNSYAALSKLSGNHDALQESRMADEKRMYDEAAAKATKLRQEQPPHETLLNSLMRTLVDRNWDVLKELPDTPAGRAVRNSLNEIQYLGGEIGEYVRKAVKVRSDLEKSGVTMEAEGETLTATDILGSYMLAKHIISNRSEIANTGGRTAATEQDKLNFMRKQLGAEKYKLVVKAAESFQKHREYVIKRMEDSDIVTPDLLALIKQNTDYAHVDVQKYMDKKFGTGSAAGAGWKKHAEGTLDDINNVYIATVLQDMSIMRMAAINEAKRSISDVFVAQGSMTPAEMKFDANVKGMRPVDPGDATKGILTVLVKGKPVHYVVEKHVAELFKYDPIRATQMGKIFGYVTQYFRDVLVSKNPAWMVRNLYRDFKGTVKNNPEIAWWNPMDRLKLLKDYREAFKEVYADVMKGERSKDIETMHQERMLAGDRMFANKEMTFDNELERLAYEFSLGKMETSTPVLKQAIKFYNYLDKLGKISEQTSKVAGYKFLRSKGLQYRVNGELAARVRERIGTPDYKRQGSLQQWTNNLMIFSNVNKEGIRSGVEAFKSDPMSYAMKTIESNILPKLLLGAAAAGYFGDDIKKIVKKIPSWDRRSYNVIPVPDVMTRELKDRGVIGKDAAVYIRLPMDYEGQFFGSVAYDMINGDWQKVSADIQQGQPYKPHPVISAALDMFVYSMGGNPTDSFRQREILTREQQKYHQVEGNLNSKSLEGLGKSMWNQIGLGNFYRMDNKEFPKELTITERSLKSFPLNAVGTYLTVTDAGHQEQLGEKIFGARDKKAIQGYEVGDKINEAVREGKVSPLKRRELYNSLVASKMVDRKTYTFGRFNSQFTRSIQQKRYGIKPTSKKEAKILEADYTEED